MRTCSCCALLLSGVIASATGPTIAIPMVTVPLTIEGQPVAITTGGTLTKGDGDQFRIHLQVDLSDFQRNLPAILRTQLDRSDACGERIEFKDAVLVPQEPSGIMTVKLHYERWACVKALGKKIEKRLVGGNGVVPVKLTPMLSAPATVRLSAEVGAIEADGSLGELLHSGTFGEAIREKVTRSLQSAIDKSTNWNATIPAALESILSLRSAMFQDGGAGRLLLVAEGDIRIPAAQMEMLTQELSRRSQ